MTSIQDFGRKGLGYYAIPNSGVMDTNSARIALLLLNLKEPHPLIECTSIAPQIRFKSKTKIAITGADFNWKINDESIHVNSVIDVSPGDVLKGGIAKNGLRGYIAINGALQIEQVYDSFSTYTNAKLGGFEGRLLKKGDVINWDLAEVEDFDQILIPIRKGPEYDLLSNESKILLFKNTYRIGSDSNRMGVRLEGTILESAAYQLENSLPILPGFIQLPPSGLPIIVLQDGQLSGGYPRIAYVVKKYLSRFNQIPLGGSFQFVLY